MPEIRPLRGWRFSGPADLGARVAPPYDVITPRAAQGLRDRDAHNIVRLILPEDTPGTPESRYENAAVELRGWREAQVLRQDAEPSFYPYRQTYRVHDREEAQRTGFLGLLRLQPFGPEVMAHEHTLAGPKEDRFRLLEATRTNLSPVFVLFEDPSGTVRSLLESAMQAPRASFALREQGELDECWRVVDPAVTSGLEAALASQPLVFADGHHRYESALRFKETLEQRGEPVGSAGYLLAYFAPVPQPGLSILPTHRMVHGLPPERLEGLLARIAERFEVRRVCRWRDTSAVQRWEREAVGRPGSVLGVALQGSQDFHEAVLTPARAAEVLSALPEPLRTLDVCALHQGILEGLLGIGEAELRSQSHVRYSHESAGALEELQGDAQAVFVLRPTPIESVFHVARHGLRMPQKSTFFYPKLSTGFVVHGHE